MKGMFVLMRFDPQSSSEPETFLPLAKTLDMTVRPIEVSFMVSFQDREKFLLKMPLEFFSKNVYGLLTFENSPSDYLI